MKSSKSCENLINLINQSTKSILQVIDNFIVKIESEKLKKLTSNKINEYDLIIEECKMIMKDFDKTPEDMCFFDKYQNLISLKLSSLKKITDIDICENIYLAISETMPDLYKELNCLDDEKKLLLKLIEINEDYLANLKPLFRIED